MTGEADRRNVPRRVPGPPAGALRLADVLASVSLLADLGFGLPAEESMRACLISTALARHVGLGDMDVADVFYTALLQHLGCNGYAHEAAARYGDELAMNAAAARTNLADGRDVVATYLRAVTTGRRPLDRARIVLLELFGGSTVGRQYASAACEVGRATARRLGLSEGVQRGLTEVYEVWNGKGGAYGLKGDAISLPARFAQVGAVAALFAHLGGREIATKAVRQQAGSALDPWLAGAFVDFASAIPRVLDLDDVHAAVLDAEPSPHVSVAPSRLPDTALAIADVADLKSTFTLGHSAGVADLARAAGERLGLDGPTGTTLQVAALLHDVGRVGVSDSVWERPGPLSDAQWEQVRLHAYQSERILVRSPALKPAGVIAGLHHERLDGSGYHRGSRARDLSMPARILAAADVYQAMTQTRAHRPKLPPEEAAAQLQQEVRAGRLDPDASAAVLDAAGAATRRVRRETPAGLSEREVEVLQALTRGLTNRQIADRFAISPRTAEHHVQHIYAKIGESSRAAAALFAMEHNLLDQPNG
jgi:HD-GYP domain-containing protein (c-di-GMP phosphodiesterase class II)